MGRTGVLLLLSPADRKARIELGSGYGPESKARTDFVMETVIVPASKRRDYGTALLEGTRQLTASLLPRRDFTVLRWVATLVLAAGLLTLVRKRKLDPGPRALVFGGAGFCLIALLESAGLVQLYVLLWSGALLVVAFRPEQRTPSVAVAALSALVLSWLNTPAGFKAGIELTFGFLGYVLLTLVCPLAFLILLLALSKGSSGDSSGYSASSEASSDSYSSSIDSSSSYDSGGSSYTSDSGGGGSYDSGSTGSW